MKLVHGSLFSGFDAPSIASFQMGWENAFHCEVNDFCNIILKYWFPNSEHYEDIAKTDFKKWRGKIDILTGGFPCQPFSVAGQRKGTDDNRYLWPQMLRAIQEIQPTWVIGENVAGILTMVQPGEEAEVASGCSIFDEDNRKRVLLRQEYVIETICQDLEREGYSVQPMLIPACAVGAPHRRDRVWFVAHRTNAGTEDVRREWKNTILSDGTASNSDNSIGCKNGPAPIAGSKRCCGRCDNREERCIYNDQERNSEENKWKRDKWQHRTGADGSVASNSQCQGSRQVHEEIQSEKPDGDSTDRNGHEWDAAYSYSEKLQKRFKAGRRPDTKKDGTGMDNGSERFGGLQYAPDSDNKRLQGFHASQWDDAEKREIEERCSKQYSCDDGRTLPTKNWEDFPTQPPVCSRDDGLSFDVDSLTIPFTKWRQESIKGYGNAIVPQVILEIYKTIEEVEKLALQSNAE
ncbi:C-5 cytosine-specific DNA methylase [Bacteroides sp. 4_1_36]|uniref:DNA cytosine methyltransferase n=1 Tax=Bacteroides sp. 4_1_36 TaxID=457393 RepID=UPI0001EFFC44|nr:DNA cytosine methyltransferase [Bacteroides sp. 4_1_36]EFV24477.1 C-5 cytosine-specific DNA methylase [Bacteroides sp. 4_1_36]